MTTSETIILSRKLASAILLCGMAGLYFIPHDFLFNTAPTLCIHKRLLGFDCPGCGMTRALYSLLHLDFRTALHFNFGVFVLLPLFITEIILGLYYNGKLFQIKKVLYYLLCISLTTIYILRIINQVIL
jgi:hypothetical protein